MIRVSSSALLDPITNRLKDTTSTLQCVPLLSASVNQIIKLFIPQIGLIVHKHLIGMVKVLARVISRTFHDTFTTFHVSDGSHLNGLKIVSYRGSRIDPEAISNDQYFKFYGKVKLDTDGSPTLVAYTIIPITEFNEISVHCCEVMRESLELRKMKNRVNKVPNSFPSTTQQPPPTTFSVPASPTLTTTSTAQVNISPTIPEGQSSNKVNEPSIGSSNRPVDFPTLNGLQSDILNLLVKCEKPEGLSKQEIREAFPGASLTEVQAAIDFLDFEAHIYPTIDEDHFKSVWD